MCEGEWKGGAVREREGERNARSALLYSLYIRLSSSPCPIKQPSLHSAASVVMSPPGTTPASFKATPVA